MSVVQIYLSLLKCFTTSQNHIIAMYILIVIIPLLGFFGAALFGSALGTGAIYLTIFLLFITLCLSLTLLYNVIQYSIVYKYTLGNWISVASLNVDWSFCFDSLTAAMLVVVTTISFFVHLYSSEYMKEDPHLLRFMSYLSLFTFFMLILVTANNFLQMFVGWEGVGLSSFLLINFWFTRIQANKAAIKAMFVNRIGDFFIVLALLIIYGFCNTLDYDIVFSQIQNLVNYNQVLFFEFKINAVDIISLLIFFGAMGKSAQLLLHVWLPDAMEGPTPVSALIHAATMVTAGIFLIARCSHIFEYSKNTLAIISIIGALTAIFGASTALSQFDLKKVIAYSTCSQLGYMIHACGLSCYEIGVFHLATHAFFKALLFLGAGAIIHSVSDEQDMRKLGGLKDVLPLSYAAILIGSLALGGFPYLAGFYSKDAIVEASLYYSRFVVEKSMGSVLSVSSALVIAAAYMTMLYSISLIYDVFINTANGPRKVYTNLHESGWKISVTLTILSILSVIVGYLFKELFIGVGGDFWNNAIFISPDIYFVKYMEFGGYYIKLTLFLMICLSAIVGSVRALEKSNGIYKLYSHSLKNPSSMPEKQISGIELYINCVKELNYFFSRKWYFDKIYNQAIAQYSLIFFEYFSYIIVDRGILELVGPTGGVNTVKKAINIITFLQSGRIIDYAFMLFLSAIWVSLVSVATI
jgi:proton-translocating NADH-quinone oxidoreductase chain L